MFVLMSICVLFLILVVPCDDLDICGLTVITFGHTYANF